MSDDQSYDDKTNELLRERDAARVEHAGTIPNSQQFRDSLVRLAKAKQALREHAHNSPKNEHIMSKRDMIKYLMSWQDELKREVKNPQTTGANKFFNEKALKRIGFILRTKDGVQNAG